MFVWHIEPLVRFIQTTITNTLRTNTQINKMSSTANDVAAKLAERANARKQLEERRMQLEEEAEQECLKEERLAKELEEMRAEEEWKAEEKREAERQAEERRKREEEEARATKAFAQREAEVLRKQLEEERTGESAMLDRQIVWRTKAGWICGECPKGERKCLWLEASSWTKACHSCSALKVKCVVAGEESEAGPLKKRKMAVDKGKGKAKEVKETKSEPEFGFRELVEELRGLRQDLKELRTDFRSMHRVAIQIANRTADMANDLEVVARHFVPFAVEQEEEGEGNSGNAGEAEDEVEETLQ